MGSPYYCIKLMFEKILHELASMNAKISALSQEIKAPRPAGNTVYLSTGIQVTVDALKTFSAPATAEEIALVTGRARAVESAHLNELFRMGLARKEKRCRVRVFSLKDEGGTIELA